MKKVALKIPEKDTSDSFAERADAYYQQRPQLLALLQELYIATAKHLPRTIIIVDTLPQFHH
ncbi:protein NETWORKED 3A-like [Capsicum annuum]